MPDTITLAAADVCKTAIWDRITGWEVVVAVLFIVAAWAAVQIARMYYMAVMARIGVNDG